MGTIQLFNKLIAALALSLVTLFVSGEDTLWAQVNEHNISIYNTSNGLTNNNINTIFPDSKGLLWIGTNDGLSRFDGYRFTSYRYCDSDSNCIAGNMIRAIDETNDGNVWVATAEHGLCIWQRQTDDFICLNKNPKIKQLPESDILGMKVIDNKVYVKTRNYLSVIDPQTLSLQSAPIIENLIRKYNHGIASIVPINSNKQIIIGGIDGCHLYDIDNHRFIKSGLLLNENSSVYCIAPLGTNQIMTTNDGIKIFDGSLKILKDIPITDHDFSNTGITPAGDTAIWMVGGNNLELLSIKDLSRNTLICNISSLKEIGAFSVSCAFEDKNHNLWVGTKHDGLMRIDLKSSKFSQMKVDDPANFPSTVSGMNFTKDGIIVFAAGNKGIGIITPSERNKPRSVKYMKIPGRDAHSTLVRKNGTIWVATNAGIFIIDPRNNKVTEFDYTGQKEFENLIGQNKINSLIEDRLDNIWMASSFGLFRYNGTNITSFFCENSNGTELCNDWVNVVYEDRQGWIWVGTNEGVRYLIPGEKDFVTARNISGKQKMLSNDHVLSFCQISDQEIMIGTRSGLTIFSKNNNSFTIFPNNILLTNDVVNNIVIDRKKQIWLGTNNGVSMINPSNEIFNFHSRDGIRNSNFYRGSMGEYDDRIYFAGINGIDYIDPAAIAFNTKKPDLVFSSIWAEQRNGTKRTLRIEDGQIDLRYKKSQVINIEFSSLDFTFPERCFYKVFIDGYDKKWSAPSNSSKLTLFNLPPGEYVLNILGSNSDQVWNDTPLQLKIKIVPPLWQTKYAYAFYFVIVLFLLHMIGNYRLFKIKKEYQTLEIKNQAKGMLEEQRDKLAKVHQSLKDSISYAKRIQEALIPSEDLVRILFQESFVYFRPKDIVSGDFYWSFENKEKQIIVAADCTGHGVPGAFMSIIGLDLIKNAVEQQMVYEPDTILSILNKGIHATFAGNGSKDNDGFHINDGMDIAICVIDRATGMMTYSGGMSSIYLIRDNEMFTYKGDRRPIGSVASGESYTFEKQEIQLQNKDYIYLFSDGYADQFGGPEGKKFKYRRFRHLLLNIHKLPSQDQKNIIHQKFEEWIGTKYEQIDDILVMGFAYIQEERP